MALTKENDYYQLFVELVEYSCKCAEELKKLFDNYDNATLADKLKDFHKIENDADIRKHLIMEKLTKEFITPIEREDILAVVNMLDDITDGIEDIPIKLYMFHIQSIREDARAFLDVILQCCEALRVILQELHNHKRSKTIQQSIIEVNRLEEVGDSCYIKAVYNLYDNPQSALEVLAWTEVFNQMEKCCDSCEHTANLVEEVIMKNA